MIYARLLFLALIACLCEVQGSCMRRGPGVVPCVVPRVPTSPCRAKPYNSGSRYERTLEDIISKLINALIYTSIQNGGSAGGGGGIGGGIGGGGSGGSGGGGTGSGGGGTGGNTGSGSGSAGDLLRALLELDLDLGGQNVLDLLLLPETIRGGGSNGGGGSGISSLLDLDLRPLLELTLLGQNLGKK